MAKRVFILGGGAALGAHQVGALRYLEEQGIRPDAIVGSSIGVINACAYACGGLANLERAWDDFRSLPRIISPSLRHNPVLGLSLFSMDRLSTAVEQHIDFREVFASPLELAFVVLNLSRGAGEVRGKETCADWRELRTLSRAGYAIPLLFPPVQIGQDWFVDGGFAWNVPLEHALGMGATEIYLLAPIASQLPYRLAFLHVRRFRAALHRRHVADDRQHGLPLRAASRTAASTAYRSRSSSPASSGAASDRSPSSRPIPRRAAA